MQTEPLLPKPHRFALFLAFVLSLAAFPPRAAAVQAPPKFAPDRVEFPNEVVGVTSSATSPEVQVRYVNPRAGAPLAITSVAITGTDPTDFAVASSDCQGTLAKGANCYVRLTFTPTALGAREGTLTIKDDLGSHRVPLAGRGVPGLFKIAPKKALSFGRQQVGATSGTPLTVTLTNQNPVAIAYTSAQATGSFAVQSTDCAAAVPANSSCHILITVTPFCPMAEQGALLVANPAPSPPLTLKLTVIGVGVNPGGSAPPLALIAGGSGGTGAPLATAEIFNSATCKFTKTAAMASPRIGHTATWLDPNVVPALGGDVLITGGTTDRNGTITAAAEIYDPATGKFTSAGAMNDPRTSHTATLLTEGPLAGQVLIVGGLTTGATPDATAELFDPASGTFSYTTGALNVPRGAHTAFAMVGCGASCAQEGDVLIAGGLDGSGNPLNSAEVFNQNAESFTCVAGVSKTTGLCNRSMSSPRWKDAIAPGAGGRVYMIEGDNLSNTVNPGAALRSTDVYNPANQVLSQSLSLIDGRQSETIAPFANGLLGGLALVAGGVGVAGQPLATAEILNVAHNNSVCVGGLNPVTNGCNSAMVAARSEAVSVSFASGPLTGAAIVAGGRGGGRHDPINSAELFNDITSGFIPLPHMVAARAGATMTVLP